MPAAPFEVELSVTVPVLQPDGRLDYVTCPQLETLTALDLIDAWADVAPVLKAHGHAVGNILRRTPYPGFRITARGQLSRRLLGVGEWSKSRETGEHRASMLWTAEGLFPLNPWGAGPVIALTGISHVVPRVGT